MKKFWLKVGMIVFWCSWPLLWIYFQGSRRTRLLIICGEEFLVLRGWFSTGNWNLPGGGLHRNEEPLTGLIREVEEETALKFTEEQVTFFYTGMYKEFGFRFVYDCYVAQVPQKPKISLQKGEIVGYAWQSIRNPNVRLGQDVREALDKWLNQR